MRPGWRLWMAPLVLLAACYRPSLAPGRFQCTATEDCPEGQVCAGGLCQFPGEADLSASSSDGGTADLRTNDLRMVDLVGADLLPVPCSGGGTELTATVHACKGNFANLTEQRALCGTGYHICGEADRMALAVVLLTVRCAGPGGFYATRLSASIDEQDRVSCPPRTGEAAALLGCGSEGGTKSFFNVACYGFHVAFPCRGPGTEWRCTTGLDSATHMNGGGVGGVLCCRD